MKYEIKFDKKYHYENPPDEKIIGLCNALNSLPEIEVVCYSNERECSFVRIWP